MLQAKREELQRELRVPCVRGVLAGSFGRRARRVRVHRARERQGAEGGRVVAGKKQALRPDTTLAPVGEPEAEMYVWGLPGCCLKAFKEAVVGTPYDRLLESL